MKPGYSLWIFSILVGLLAGLALADAELGWPKAIPNGFGSGGIFPVGAGGEPGEVELYYNAGLRVSRSGLGWKDVETEKGKYNFSRYDGRIEMLTKHGIRPLFILGGTGSIVTEEARKAFVAGATAAAERYAGKNIIYEIWNEPNIFFWSPQTPTSIEDYCKLVAAVAPAIHQADPTAKVIAPATSEIPLDWLEQAFKFGILEHLDGVSVHPYRANGAGYAGFARTLLPETVVPEYERLRELIRRYAPKGKNIPILSTEWGYSCSAKMLSPEQQAAYLVRMLLIHQWQGVPVTIWFDWKNWSDDWNHTDSNAGIVTNDLKPKTAYIALKVLSETLNGFEFDRKVDLPDKDLYVLAFRKGGQMAYAIWTTGELREFALPIMGAEVKLTLMASQNPRYLILPGLAAHTTVPRNVINLQEGIVLYLPFDESSGSLAKDMSGNGHTGKVINAKWTEGKFGKALEFNGQDSYVEVPFSDAFKISDALTLAAWVKPKASSLQGWHGIINARRSADGPYRIQLAQGFAEPGFSLSGRWVRYKSAAQFKEGEWCHIVVTYDSSLRAAGTATLVSMYGETAHLEWADGVKIYTNGKLSILQLDQEAARAAKGKIDPLAEGIFIGHNYGQPGRFFEGVIDEVVIYNRALSDEEVEALYMRQPLSSLLLRHVRLSKEEVDER